MNFSTCKKWWAMWTCVTQCFSNVRCCCTDGYGIFYFCLHNIYLKFLIHCKLRRCTTILGRTLRICAELVGCIDHDYRSMQSIFFGVACLFFVSCQSFEQSVFLRDPINAANSRWRLTFRSWGFSVYMSYWYLYLWWHTCDTHFSLGPRSHTNVWRGDQKLEARECHGRDIICHAILADWSIDLGKNKFSWPFSWGEQGSMIHVEFSLEAYSCVLTFPVPKCQNVFILVSTTVQTIKKTAISGPQVTTSRNTCCDTNYGTNRSMSSTLF